jgi:hypothetical protein
MSRKLFQMRLLIQAARSVRGKGHAFRFCACALRSKLCEGLNLDTYGCFSVGHSLSPPFLLNDMCESVHLFLFLEVLALMLSCWPLQHDSYMSCKCYPLGGHLFIALEAVSYKNGAMYWNVNIAQVKVKHVFCPDTLVSFCYAASFPSFQHIWNWPWDGRKLNHARMHPGLNPGLPRATSGLFTRAPERVAYWVSGGFSFTNFMCTPPLRARPNF